MAAATPYNVSGSGAVITGVGVRYCGFAIRNSHATTTLVCRVWDNASAASGTLLDTIALPAGTAQQQHYHDGGIVANAGIYFEVVAGAGTLGEGSIRVG